MIALVGHACWQAVSSCCIARSINCRAADFSSLDCASLNCTSCFLISTRVRLSRCTQYVHFSITPRSRTVTSGFAPSRYLASCVLLYWKKLNRRTLYGQLFEQYRVPMQRLYVISLSPSALCVVAFTGQTNSHGAVSQ